MAASYADFSRVVHQRYAGVRAPIEASIEVTRRCPLECLHCYNNLPMGDLSARNQELTLDEYKTVLDELAAMGVLWILFTGGEVFARKDFLDIYQHAKRKGFLITLFTNGTLINEKIADLLAEYPPFAVEITLYGRTKETYEALTAKPGSYERCMRGIQLLLERNVPLKLKTVPTRVNAHEVYAMRDFAEQEVGVEFKFDSLVNPRIDCSQSPLAVRLSPEEVVALDMHDPKRRFEYSKLIEGDIQRPAPPVDDKVYFCGGGMNSFALDPYGNMTICVLSHQQVYNIREGGVREGWEGFLLSERNKKRTRMTKCQGCRIQSACGMCAANGELENGDAESPVEFLCEVAHLRTVALGHEVPAHGDCEYCAGGRLHTALLASAKRIHEEIDVSSWKAPEPGPFQILQQRASGSGCGSCRTHA